MPAGAGGCLGFQAANKHLIKDDKPILVLISGFPATRPETKGGECASPAPPDGFGLVAAEYYPARDGSTFRAEISITISISFLHNPKGNVYPRPVHHLRVWMHWTE